MLFRPIITLFDLPSVPNTNAVLWLNTARCFKYAVFAVWYEFTQHNCNADLSSEYIHPLFVSRCVFAVTKLVSDRLSQFSIGMH